MSSVSWGNGRVEYTRLGGESCVEFFENNGVIWYNARTGVERPGWQAELEPYEGTGLVGLLAKRAEDKGARL